MINPEESNTIEYLNAILGMKHRSKSYDYKNPDDLKEMLLISVAAYQDYRHYECSLIGLLGNYDESLEHYDTLSWFNLGADPDNVDDSAYEAMASLNDAIEAFRQLSIRAKFTCSAVLKAILTSSPDVQDKVLGQAYLTSTDRLDEEIADLFFKLDEAEYQYSMPDNLKVLLEIMKTHWPVQQES